MRKAAPPRIRTGLMVLVALLLAGVVGIGLLPHAHPGAKDDSGCQACQVIRTGGLERGPDSARIVPPPLVAERDGREHILHASRRQPLSGQTSPRSPPSPLSAG